MFLYKFPTFTTSYYFPRIEENYKHLYNIYSPYGNILSKLYWSLFKRFNLIRRISRVNINNLNFPYKTIINLVGKDKIISFNMGSPGIYNKISMIGYDPKKDESFFAKFSTKKEAMELTKNEIRIYKVLGGSNLTPKILDYKIQNNFTFLKAEYIKGERPKSFDISSNIVNICVELSQLHLDVIDKNKNLITCLSHGDFCPWNMIVNNNQYKLIDWEMAAERPLGFDLFTYICQVTNLLKPEITLIKAIETNVDTINYYFKIHSIEDWVPYLKAFAEETKNFKIRKGNAKLAERYNCLITYKL